MMLHFILLSCAALLPGISGNFPGSWDNPPFSSEMEGEVIIGDVNEAASEQQIHMWEEIEPLPYAALKMNFKGTETIKIIEGDPYEDFSVTKVNGEWYFNVEHRRDYEVMSHQSSLVILSVEDEDQKVLGKFQIFVNLVNILDNGPIFTGGQESCAVNEKEKDFTTECFYNVLHPDAFIENNIKNEFTNKLTIEIPDEFREHFELEEAAVDPEDKDRNYNRKYFLKVLKELDYSQKAIYNMETTVFDLDKEHSATLKILIQVLNVESRNPIFTRPFTTQRILEKTTFQEQVTAIDGDTGLNRPICYDLKTTEDDHARYFSIDETTGVLKVEPIDRDAEQNEFYQFSITAFKCHNRTFNTINEAAIILEDQNDHWPEFEVKPVVLRFWENTLQTLDFERFEVNDPDLGIHATYTLVLNEKVNDEQQQTNSFSIIPQNGYQRTAFTVTIVDATLLDFELPERQKFQLVATATEVSENTHQNSQIVEIELMNWNDEVPKFDQEEYKLSIPETTGADVSLLRVRVSDRDIGDEVVLTILGRIRSELLITKQATENSPVLGSVYVFEISTINDNIFDWDVSQEVIIQLQAQDSLTTSKNEPVHTVNSQVIISVQDVNNKAPTIVLPRGKIHIEENSPPGMAVSNGDEDAIIIGTDPDSEAELKFSIDWDRSYATKEGVEVNPSTLQDCLLIEIVDASDRNRVRAKMIVNPVMDQATINEKLDYETFQTLFLTLKLEDTNQTILPNTDEVTFVIQLDDVNDNPPEFVGNTLEVPRFVLEEADANTIVGTILAVDKDGPPHNIIQYSIRAENPLQEGYLNIDDTGVLTVAMDKGIGCDIPPEDFINIEVTITDSLFYESASIKISITDTNNKIPNFLDESNPPLEIFEKSDAGTEIVKLMVQDDDRDEDYYTVSFEIILKSDASLQNFFEVVRLSEERDDKRKQTALVRVRENNQLLDRDYGTASFNIPINAVDNPSGLRSDRRNSIEKALRLVLLDINDQTPQLPALTLRDINEDLKKDAVLVEKFEATDADDKNTPNAKINYRIIDIEPVSGSTPEAIANEDVIEQLFVLEQTDDFLARLKIGHDLKGFYGNWAVKIQACDRGDEYQLKPGSKKLCEDRVYDIEIEPYNYMAPVIDYPERDKRIRLRLEPLIAGRPLFDTEGNQIPNFRATDTDGGQYGEVSWTLESQEASGTDHLLFDLIPAGKNEMILVLLKVDVVAGKQYRIRVKAQDGGGREAISVDVPIIFIDKNGQPMFEVGSWNTDFTENVNGTTETREIPEAKDPSVEDDQDSNQIFYFIDTSFEDHQLFKLEEKTRILRVAEPLDREEVAHHTIRIIATFNEQKPPETPDDNSMLVVNIKVNDVNDNPPRFIVRSYAAGITITDRNRNLFTVVAEDPDEIDSIRYSIQEGSLQGHGNNLVTSPMPFELDPVTGVLQLVGEVTRDMSGFYTFTIVAEDEVLHNDKVTATVYIIAEINRVKFVFLNERTFIDTPEIRNTIREIFTEAYELECNIDDVGQGTIEKSSRQDADGITDVRAHFIRDNIAVEALEIQQRSNDRLFVTNLKRALLEKNLNLQDVPISSIDEIAQKNELLEIVLIVVASALAIVCVILLVAFCIKIRSLNRQLRALSANDFGSIASDLQKPGRKVPTTNVFSVEGSNPVLNDQDFIKGAYDDVSVQSYESDFIGIDNDLFANNRKDSINPALVDHIRQRVLNPLANGSKPNPSAPQSDEKSGIEPRIYLTRDEGESGTDVNRDELAHRF
ncbi:cadherin-23-like [Uranotaenia lowii]|uniref:cadherin-23-like n=1 Tax=Uranotaenia lowii TaxID=190385 RepID=UPI0024793249|nr:cadherin-23-like [Uranotaenia lowii]XP_055614737.1 cadherin-23-like [Uranotaenia lowii]